MNGLRLDEFRALVEAMNADQKSRNRSQGRAGQPAASADTRRVPVMS